MRIKLVLLFVLTVFVAGCSPDAFLKASLEAIAPDDDEAMAKEFMAAMRAGDVKKAVSMLDPQFIKPGVEAGLGRLSGLFNQGNMLSVELVGCQVYHTANSRRSDLTYEYHFKDSWLLVSVIIDTAGAKKKVFGATANPAAKSLAEANALTFAGKGLEHFAMVVAAVLAPLFILVVLVICVRTPFRRGRKWVWILFVLSGVGTVSLNWATGAMNLQLFSFSLMGASIMKMGPYSPWIVSASFPLGAVWFLTKRKTFQTPLPDAALPGGPPALPKDDGDGGLSV